MDIQEQLQLNERFRELNNRHNNIYQFVMTYNDYILSKHDYGTGQMLSMIEAHTLTYIEENPGSTITGLSKYWNKTKGALSQTVSKLVDKGLVYRHKTQENAKTVLLYVTDEGLKLSRAHKLYDTIDIAKTMGDLLKECSIEEIESFYKVISIYIKLLEKDFK